MDRTSVAVLLCLGTAWGARDNSAITYVRIQPITSRHAPPPLVSLRESRIENLPLTIGSPDTVRRVRSEQPTTTETYQDTTLEELTLNRTEGDKAVTPEPKFYEKQVGGRRFYQETTLEDRELTIRTEAAKEVTPEPKFYEKQVPGPRFYSKLSYFSKPTEDDGGVSTNLVSGFRRKYRSRCRCERIWNCPKLQITVPRCPEEYFLCCF